MEKIKIILPIVALLGIAFGVIFFLRNNLNENNSLPVKTVSQRQVAPPAKIDLPEAPAINGSSLLFDQKQINVSKGQEFTLKTNIDPAKNKITAVELHFSYDPKILKLENIEKSDYFNTELSVPKIDDKNGTASVALGVDLGKNPVSSIVAVAELKFKALESGAGDIVIDENSKAAGEGYANNVITSRQSSKINVE